MKNYYFILTFNIGNPVMKRMLGRIGFTKLSSSINDLKIRSKVYATLNEVTGAASSDFKLKLPELFPDSAEHIYHVFCVSNPTFELAEAIGLEAAKAVSFNRRATWDDDCCMTLFFTEDAIEGEELPRDWIMKYEVFALEDTIEYAKNGEGIFTPAQADPQNFSSQYH